MDFFTHIIVNIAIARLITKNPDKQRAFVIGGMAPDFDVIVSWLPRLFPQLYFLSHRSLFHTLLFIPFVLAFIYFLIPILAEKIKIDIIKLRLNCAKTSITAFTLLFGVLGATSHFFLDIITPGGLAIFFPFTEQRFSTSTIMFFDPIISVMSISLSIWIIYTFIIKKRDFDYRRIHKYSTIVTGTFFILLITYGSLQVHTIQTHQPDNNTATFIPFYRWIAKDQGDQYKIELINQITQNSEFSYLYNKTDWNQSEFSFVKIDSVITKAKQTLDYKNFFFNLGPDSIFNYNLTFNASENEWRIIVIDIFRHAQMRMLGIESNGFNSKVEIILLNENI